MEFGWREAVGCFGLLDKPLNGDGWKLWVQKMWVALSDAGMVPVKTPADETICRLRVIALSWLAHDFCSSNGDESTFNNVCWQDRFEACLVNPLWAFLTITPDRDSPSFINDAIIFSETSCPNFEDKSFPLLSKQIGRDLELRLALSALWHERMVTQHNLFKCFDQQSLFASMFVARFSEQEIKDLVQTALLKRIDWLKDQLRSNQSDDMHLWLQGWIFELNQKLTDDSLRKEVMQLRNEIESSAFQWKEYRWLEEMECFKWVAKSCPVLLHGQPDVIQPTLD
jgi:hypothetical protein